MPDVLDVIRGSDADDSFLQSMSANHQKRLLSAIRTLRENILNTMRDLKTSNGGKLHGPKTNLKQAQKIHKQLVNQFEKDYNIKVSGLLGDFGAIDRWIQKRYKSFDEAAEFTGIDKTMTNALRNNAYDRYIQFGEDARNRVATAMYQSVAGQAKMSVLLDTITGILTGHKDVRGRSMTMYAKGFAQDAVMNYHNQVHTAKGEQLGMKHFLYYGAIIATSRPFCIRRVGKVYTKRQIDSWDRMEWKGKSGPAFTERGGYNCTHHWRPVRKAWLTDEDGEQLSREEIAGYMAEKDEPQAAKAIKKLEATQAKLDKALKKSDSIRKQYYAMKGKKGKDIASKRKDLREKHEAAVALNKQLREEIKALRAEVKTIGAKVIKKQKKVIAKPPVKKVKKVKAPKKKVVAKKTAPKKAEPKQKSAMDELFDAGISSVVDLNEGTDKAIKNFEKTVLRPLANETTRITGMSKNIAGILKRNPINFVEIGRERTLPELGRNSSRGTYWNSIKRIALGSRGVDDADKVAKRFVKNQWSASEITGNPITTWRHEFAHHIHYRLLDDKEFAGTGVYSVWNDIWNRKGSNWFKKNVTVYSGTNFREAFADSFTIYSSPKYVRGDLPDILENYFDALFGDKVPSHADLWGE